MVKPDNPRRYGPPPHSKVEDAADPKRGMLLYVVGLLVAAYLAGVGTYGGVLKLAQLETISTAKLEALNKTAGDEVPALEAAVKTLTTDNANLIGANKTLLTEIARLRSAADTLTAKAGEVSNLHLVVNALTADNAKLRPANDTLNSENTALKAQNKALSELTTAQKSQVAGLDDQLAKLRTENGKLKDSLPESTANKTKRWKAAIREAKDLPDVSKAGNSPLFVNRHYLLTTLLTMYSLNLDTLQLPVASMIEELFDCPRNPDRESGLNTQLSAAAFEKIARLRVQLSTPMQ
jgi:cell division protein FtsB